MPFLLDAQLSDDFEQMYLIGQWQIFHPGDSEYYQSIMYHDSLIEGEGLSGSQGKLVMTSGHTYWYADVTGPFIYQLTWGDFTATADVRSLDRDNTDAPPQSEFNSTGLLVRNPEDTYGQNYIMTNLGMQSYANQIGSESKTTVGSISTLFLDPDLHEGEVRITRTGSLIRTYKRTGDDTDFVLLDEFDRPDIPDTVQIGMILNGYTDDPDIRGEFEQIHFSGGDCRVVRHGEDAGINSLRDAIACAVNGDTIRFDHVLLPDTLTVTSLPLVIDKDLVFFSNSASVIVQGSGLQSLMDITPDHNVTLIGLNLFASDHQGTSVIYNAGTLSLIDCTVSANLDLPLLIENTGVLIVNGVSYLH